jgi:repressor LexA
MTSKQASDIQQRMYKFIEKYIKAEGMPPTNREIGHELDISSTGHVDYHLTMMEKNGLIARQPKKSRGIKLMRPAGISVNGTIAAGQPLEIFSDPEQKIDVGHELEHDNTYALLVKGRSMIEDHICDGDYVVIKPQPTCNNGDIVVAVHRHQGGSGSATLKRFFREREHDRIRLQPANSELEPIYVPGEEWDAEWEVQGKVVAIFRRAA